MIALLRRSACFLGVLLFIFSLYPDYRANALEVGRPAGAPTITWSPSALELEVTIGTQASYQVDLISSETLHDVGLRVVPALAPYFNLEPSSLPALDANSSTRITVNVDLRTVAGAIDLDGTVQLRTNNGSGQVLARPLPIRLIGKEPDSRTYKISGYVTNAQGVTVTAYGPQTKSTLTDAAGMFSLEGLPQGQYTISPTQPGSIFDPEQLDVTLIDHDINGLVFVPQVPPEDISEEVLQQIDQTPESSLPDDQVILPNGISLRDYLLMRGITLPSGTTGPAPSGMSLLNNVAATAVTLPPASGPQEKKNDVIASMVMYARILACGRANPPCTMWDYAADPADPVNMPAQTGLTYVYGGKIYGWRTQPVDGCPEKTYGLDCSGLIYTLAGGAGIHLPDGTAARQSNPAEWSIPPEWHLQMKLVTDGSIETGDILGWGSHIGIAETGGTSVNVISSTGRSGQCTKNITPPRGPRSLSLSGLGLGKPTTTLRLVTDLSGTFDMRIKCDWASYDAAVLRFIIDNDSGGPFTSTGSGVDYDGRPLCFTLNGNYAQTSNTVSAMLSLCDNTRKDWFSIKLLFDDTGYFPLTKIVDNGGCYAEARLIRVPDPGPTQPSPSTAQPDQRNSASGPQFGGAPPK